MAKLTIVVGLAALAAFGVAQDESEFKWVLTDYGDVVVHSLTPKARAYYDLERLCREGKPVEIPAEAPVVRKTRAAKSATQPASTQPESTQPV